MADIVERLRKGIEWTGPTQDDTGQTENYMDEAADLITALRAENEKLNSDIDDASTDLATARQDNASLTGGLKSLRAEVERLRAALESIADLPPGYADMRQDDLVMILASKARAALEEKP